MFKCSKPFNPFDLFNVFNVFNVFKVFNATFRRQTVRLSYKNETP